MALDRFSVKRTPDTSAAEDDAEIRDEEPVQKGLNRFAVKRSSASMGGDATVDTEVSKGLERFSVRKDYSTETPESTETPSFIGDRSFPNMPKKFEPIVPSSRRSNSENGQQQREEPLDTETVSIPLNREQRDASVREALAAEPKNEWWNQSVRDENFSLLSNEERQRMDAARKEVESMFSFKDDSRLSGSTSFGDSGIQVPKSPRQRVTDLFSYTMDKSGVNDIVKLTVDIGDALLDTAPGATIADATANVFKGIVSGVEAPMDAIALFGAQIADWTGNKDFAEALRYTAGESIAGIMTDPLIDRADKKSWMGKDSMADAVAQGVGQLIVDYGVVGAFKLLGWGVKGVSMGIAAFRLMRGVGSGYTDAYGYGKTVEEQFDQAILEYDEAIAALKKENDPEYAAAIQELEKERSLLAAEKEKAMVSNGEAWAYGALAGGIEAALEALSGGLGKGIDAIGLSRGIGGVDDMIASKIASVFFKNGAAKNVVSGLVKSGGEALEELGTGALQGLAQKWTYRSHEKLADIMAEQELLKQGGVGFLVSAIAQGGGIRAANKGGYDYVTGLTPNVKAALDVVYETKLAEATANGQKLSRAAQNKLYNNIVESFTKGTIQTDILQSAYQVVMQRSMQGELETILTKSGIDPQTAAALAKPMSKAVVQDYRMTEAELDLLSQNPTAQALMAEMNDTFAAAKAEAQAQAAATASERGADARALQTITMEPAIEVPSQPSRPSSFVGPLAKPPSVAETDTAPSRADSIFRLAPDGNIQTAESPTQLRQWQTEAKVAESPALQSTATNEGGNDNGRIFDGDEERHAGMGAGGEVGSLRGGTEQTEATADTGSQRAVLADHLSDRGVPLQSTRSFGITRGTDSLLVKEVPVELWDDAMRATDERVHSITGKHVRFVVGQMQIQTASGTRNIRGVRTDNGIVVQANHPYLTAEKIAAHETFHELAALYPQLYAQAMAKIEERHPDQASRQAVITRYTEELTGIYGNDEIAIMEEILADAYAGINAFGAEASMYHDVVSGAVEDVLGQGRAIAADLPTRAPPVVSEMETQPQRQETEDIDALGKRLFGEVVRDPSDSELMTNEESFQSMLAKYTDESDPTAQKNTADVGGERYSIAKTSKMDYTTQLQMIENGRLNGSNYLYVGIPSSSLQQAGVSSNPFSMSQKDYRKSRRTEGNNTHYSAHGVPFQFFETLPQNIATAPLIVDNGNKMTIITETPMNDTKGEPSYIVVGVLRDVGIDFINKTNQIKSIYPWDDFRERLEKAAKNGELVVTNKNKAEEILRTIGIQPAEVSRILNLAKTTISQPVANVNTEKYSADDKDTPQYHSPYGIYMPGTPGVGEVFDDGNEQFSTDDFEYLFEDDGGESDVTPVPAPSYVDEDLFVDEDMSEGDFPTLDEVSLRQLAGRAASYLELKQKGRANLEQVIRAFDQTGSMNKSLLYSAIEEQFGQRSYELQIEDVAQAKEYIRGKKIRVTDDIKSEFGSAADYRQFFRKNFGKILFSKDGVSVDVAYEDMMGEIQNETLFPQDIINPADRLRRIAEVANTPAKQLVSEPVSQKGLQRATDVIFDSLTEYRDVEKAGVAAQEKAERTTRAEQALDARRRALAKDPNGVRQAIDYITDEAELSPAERMRSQLRDSLFDPAKRDAVGRSPAGMSIDEYTAQMTARADKAKQERLRVLSKEEFQGSDALQKLGIKVTGTVTAYDDAEYLRQVDKAFKDLKRDTAKLERKLGATSLERDQAALLADGRIELNGIHSQARANVVMLLAEQYSFERAMGENAIRRHKRNIESQLDEQMEDLFKGALDDGYKPSKALVMNYRTTERNMIRMFGDERGGRIYDKVFQAVPENEVEKIRFCGRMLDLVRKFPGADGKEKELTKTERAVAQMQLEGTAVAEEIAKMETRSRVETAAQNMVNGKEQYDVHVENVLSDVEYAAAKRLAWWLQAQEWIGEQKYDPVRVGYAVKTYTEIYNDLYDAINDFLVVHGYEPIGFVKGYAPHFQKEQTLGTLQSVLEHMGVNTGAMALPTSIAGLTSEFKPGHRWDPFLQTRHGTKTDYDIAYGFETYLDYIADVFYHTDDIMRVRRAATYFRTEYSAENISNTLQEIKDRRFASTEMKREWLIENGEMKPGEVADPETVSRKMDEYVSRLYEDLETQAVFGEFVKWLDNYANILAGKQSMADRGWEYSAGREALSIGNRLVATFARANVAANLSSVLNQSAQLPMIIAECGSGNVRRAITDILTGKTHRAMFFSESDFVTGKKGVNSLTKTNGDKFVEGTFKPIELSDRLLSGIAVRAAYLKAVKSGASHEVALRVADRYASKVMGSRIKGEKPLMFHSKSIGWQMVNIFQVEALNSWEHISQDLPREFRDTQKRLGKRAASKQLGKVIFSSLLWAFLLNRLSEELFGGTPAPFDLLGLSANFVASGEGITVNEGIRRMIDNAWQKMFGSRLFGTDPANKNEKFDWGAAVEDTAYNVSNEIPFLRNASALLGVGDSTLPMPDVAGGVKGLADSIKNKGLFSGETAESAGELIAQFLPGGRQAQKTYEGLKAMAQGGVYKGYGDDKRLQYPVEGTWDEWIRAVMFGKAGLSETNEYYASGASGLSAKQTQVYESVVDMGADREAVYDTIQAIRSAESGRNARDVLAAADLTDAQKAALYSGIISSSRDEEFAAMMGSGMTWDQITAVYNEWSSINETEGMRASARATEFAHRVDELDLTDAQKVTVKEQLPFNTGMSVTAEKYEAMTQAGLSPETAQQVYTTVEALTPEEGADEVTAQQRQRAVVGMDLSEDEKLAALVAYMPESVYSKLLIVSEYDVTPTQWVQYFTSADSDGSGNITQLEAGVWLNDMVSLTKEQRAALWQATGAGWDPRRNPYDSTIAFAVQEALMGTEEEG